MTTRSIQTNIFYKIGVTIIFILFAIWSLGPIIFMAFASLKVQVNIFKMPPVGDWYGMFKWFFGFKPTLRNYVELFTIGHFGSYVRNSFLLTITSTAICVPLALLVSYSLSRGKIPGKENIFFWVITTRMAPPVVICVPLYFLFKHWGILLTFGGMILAYTTFSLPFAIWLLRGFIDSVPIEVEEAARIDGLSRFRVFTNVVIPLIRSGLGAVIMLVTLFCWNEYLFTLVLGGRALKTMPIGIGELKSGVGVYWGRVMAGGIFVILPMVIFGIIVRRYIVKGLTMGALQ